MTICDCSTCLIWNHAVLSRLAEVHQRQDKYDLARYTKFSPDVVEATLTRLLRLRMLAGVDPGKTKPRPASDRVQRGIRRAVAPRSPIIYHPVVIDGKKYCGFPGCNDEIHARGLCKLHYDRWRRKSSPFDPLTTEDNPSCEFCNRVASRNGSCDFHFVDEYKTIQSRYGLTRWGLFSAEALGLTTRTELPYWYGSRPTTRRRAT